MNRARVSKTSLRKSDRNVKLTIGGKIQNSQIIIGDNNNIYVDKSHEKPKIRHRSGLVEFGVSTQPVDMVDREIERGQIERAVKTRTSVEIYASDGFGKSLLQEYLSYQLKSPDGKVYLIVKDKTLDEILLELFKTFFICSLNEYTPSQSEYRLRFAKVRAVILLDDVTLERKDIEELIGYLPDCIFILTTTSRQDLRRGEIIHLVGLPPTAALSLLKQRIGRSLTEDELALAEEICVALNGNPDQIVQVGGQVKFDGKSVKEIALGLKTQSVNNTLYANAPGIASGFGKKFLTLLTALKGAAMPERNLTELLGEGVKPVITETLNRNYAKAHSPRYGITKELRGYLQDALGEDVTEWRGELVSYFAEWIARAPSDDQLLDASEVLLVVVQLAMDLGLWQDALQIGQALEPVLLAKQKWGMWTKLLEDVRRAGLMGGDQFVEAWALHQLGSRALCFERFSEARDLLSEALKIRRIIGDDIGVDATRHNLDQLADMSSHKPPKSGGKATFTTLLSVGIVAALIYGFNVLRPDLTPKVPAAYFPTKTFTHQPEKPVSIFTPSRTPIPTRTKVPTATRIPSLTPNSPPPAPVLSYPKEGSVMPCQVQNVMLEWQQPYDPNGIASYEVELYYDANSRWNLITTVPLSVKTPSIEISQYLYKYCGYWIAWGVSAKDTLGDLGAQSTWLRFYIQPEVTPTVPPDLTLPQVSISYAAPNPLYYPNPGNSCADPILYVTVTASDNETGIQSVQLTYRTHRDDGGVSAWVDAGTRYGDTADHQYNYDIKFDSWAYSQMYSGYYQNGWIDIYAFAYDLNGNPQTALSSVQFWACGPG